MTNLTLLPEAIKRVVPAVAVAVLLILMTILYGCTSKTGDVEYDLKVKSVYYEEEGEEIQNDGMIAPLRNEDYTVVVQISHNDVPFSVLHIINGNNIQIPMSADEDPLDNWFQYTMVQNAGVPVKLKFYKGDTLIGQVTEYMFGQNTPPDHPECDDDDDFFQCDAGFLIEYNLHMND